MPDLPITLSELKQVFPAGTWFRAQALIRSGAVQKLDWSPEQSRLKARVLSSSGDEVYRQTIFLERDRRSVQVNGDCSCFMGHNCKHVAAALIQWTSEHPEPEAPPPSKPGLQEEHLKLLNLVWFIHGQRGDLHEPYLGQFRALFQQHPSLVAAQLGFERWEVLKRFLIRTAVSAVSSAAAPEAAPEPSPDPRPELPADLQGWLDLSSQEKRKSSHLVLYVLEPTLSRRGRSSLRIQPHSARISKQGLSDLKPLGGSSQAQYVQAELELIAMLQAWQDWQGIRDFPLLSRMLQALMDTGRVYLHEHWSQPLQLGSPRAGKAVWHTTSQGLQVPALEVEPTPTLVLPTSQPWYLDASTLEFGPVEADLVPEDLGTFLAAPALPLEHTAAFAGAMQQRLGNRLPLPRVLPTQHLPTRLIPRLTLYSEAPDPGMGRYSSRMHTAKLEYTYLGQPVTGAETTTVSRVKDGVIQTMPRDPSQEQAALRLLKKHGFEGAGKVYLGYLHSRYLTRWALSLQKTRSSTQEEAWMKFVAEGLPLLQQQGWEVVFDPGFDFRLAQAGEWYAELEEGNDWFGLELGVMVEGQKVKVLPLLVSLIRNTGDALTPEALQALPDQQLVYPRMENGVLLPLPVERVRPILMTLIELYSRQDLQEGKITLPLLDAARLGELQKLDLQWKGGEKLRELASKLQHFEGIVPAPLPVGLQATLRPYQHEGLSWLQFLREHGLSGILADDMGLGKTLQTLTHLLLEKEQGRLQKPVLIVAPTSLMHNWKAEAARFTPGLRVLVLQGKNRKQDFARLAEHDLVLTTYPLVARDFEVLSAQPYHSVILDEAQNIKNSKSATSKAIGSLQADHRLCLTGTPLENHLGELWSLFHFLMPGLLGDPLVFNQVYRYPIEKEGNVLRRSALARRLRPFILRRTKEQVAKELPPKTEMLVKLELEGSQRDLYETLRVSVQKQVQQEIASKGFARSQIAILDALLKLRQVCCDPRLLSLSEAKKVKGSVKLDWLTETLPSMLEEGRSVLIFSQFATLLGLLEQGLHTLKVPYSKITGQTQDRATEIERFQSGQTRVFLISLKAGGVGLNLTAADTVIHYDPWWNPAAENQATDRAYRIGQDKPVFVYKLITAGTLEEKILDMQHRKSALAQGILEGNLSEAGALTQQDLDGLFQPL